MALLLLLSLLSWSAAWGCYRSIADVPTIDLEKKDDSGIPIEPLTDACAQRRPWEGPGITGILPISGNTALILNGDRYFTAEFNTSGTDAADLALGSVTAWREKGFLKDLWSSAPPAVGGRPWDEPGVTAAYIDKVTGAQVIISQFRRWIHLGDDWAPGSIVDDLVVNDGGPPLEDGGRPPWAGVGVTAAAFTSDQKLFVMISQDRMWVKTTADADPAKWSWVGQGAFALSGITPWMTAMPVGGVRPYEGKGVTALAYLGPRMIVASVDKIWFGDTIKWQAAGFVKDLPVWSSAPTVGCD